jgi:RNA polymerase sigma-70 factor (ECF subfamily)
LRDPLVECILAVAARKDRAAFTRLFEYFAPRIKAWMLKAGADMQTAEEIAQETMLIVWRKAAQFRPERAAPSTWIFTIARNKRIDRLRRERRPTPEPPPEPPAYEAYGWDVLVADRKRLKIWLGELPVEQAQVLTMFYLRGKTQSDIATELELSLGTVKSRIRLALGRLRARHQAA